MSYSMDMLGNHIQVLSGYAFKTKDFSKTGIPVIKIKNVTPPSVSLVDLSYVSQEIADKNSKYILQYDDVLIALTGSHINQMASVVGRVARVKYSDKTVLNQRVGKITVLDENDCDLDFVYYYLSQHSVKIELASKAGGAANQANISPSDIKGLMIPFPDIHTQRKISSVLKVYDDFIENNQKQIKLLEEAAQRLYKEWFIDLHFPGHETTPIIDGVPQGWKEGTIQDIVVYHDKKRKPLSGMQRAEMQGKFRYYGAAGVLDYINNYLFDGTYLLLGEDGTVITEDGYPILQYVTGKFWVNNHAHVLTGNQDYPTEYLYMLFKATKVSDVVTGVAQPKISQARLSNKKTIIPNEEIVYDYCSIVTPMFKQILSLEHQIELSKEARDRLLPKLMSGELEV